MRSVTPKVLYRIDGRSLVSRAVTVARELESQHLVIVVHHERGAVIAHLAEAVPDAVPAEQGKVPDTGRAAAYGLAVLPEDLTGPVTVTSGDIPLPGTATLRELLVQHHERRDAVALLTAELENPTGYGRVVHEADGTISAVTEQRDASEVQRAIREVNAGVYVFDAIHLRTVPTALSADNGQDEAYLTDAIAHIHQIGRSIGALVATNHWLAGDCNDRVQPAELGAELNRRALTGWMAQGVGIVDPASTWVDVTAGPARDVTLEQGVLVRGVTRVGQDARAGVYAILIDVATPAGCVVAPFNQLDADTA